MTRRPSLDRYILVVLAILYGAPVHAQDAIAVDVSSPLADVARRPIGLNVNFLLDDDANRPQALRRLAEALRSAGVKYLRYPGGEKSDTYLWSVPPYTSSIPTLARWASGEWPNNAEWPSYDRALVEADGFTFRTNPLSFDEFMEICREIDCVPTIVVCYDAMYKPAQDGGAAPSRATLLETAREWVRYANVTRGYNVQYWEIGNESYLPHYNGHASPSDYARDLVEFSAVMKAVDPAIRIGANGDSDDWWQVVLSGAAASIDFLAVHNYPPYGWGSYSHYQNNDAPLMDVVETARSAIASYAPAADRHRLRIAVTEASVADWSGAWPNVNDTGHALVLFDMLGRHLSSTAVEFTQFWNSRWSGADTASPPRVFDTFNKDNNLQATGQAMAIWGQFLKEQMVASTNTSMVRSYSTYSPANRTLTVFLVNKDTRAREATVRIDNLSAAIAAQRWVFKGRDPHDVSPSWGSYGHLPTSGNLVTATLDPVSVTVLDITPARASAFAVPGTIEAEDFETFRDTTPENEGGQYRATAVDIEITSDAGGGYNVGWMNRGEWLDYTIDVQTAGTYQISARVASPVDGATLLPIIDGTPVAGTLEVPNTGGWQDWTSVQTTPVQLTAGTHALRIFTDTGGMNLNRIIIEPGDARRPAPRVIEAEDFEAFRDSTSANEGGHYRSTAVDIEPTTDGGGGYNVGWMTPGEWLEYTIAIESAGTYQIAARTASPVTTATLRVLIDGAALGDDLKIPNTGSWQSWQSVRTSPVQLTAGTHTLRVFTATGWLNLNRMNIEAIQAGRAVPATIEAEDFDAFHDSSAANEGGHYRSTAVDIEPTADSGGGYNVGWIDAGEWLEYIIEVEAGGSFDVLLRVASPLSGTSLHVEMDGRAASAVLEVPNTGSWQSWATIDVPGIRLDAGSHRLRVRTATGWFNLNKLTFVRQSGS